MESHFAATKILDGKPVGRQTNATVGVKLTLVKGCRGNWKREVCHVERQEAVNKDAAAGSSSPDRGVGDARSFVVISNGAIVP